MFLYDCRLDIDYIYRVSGLSIDSSSAPIHADFDTLRIFRNTLARKGIAILNTLI
jgi:hypothetical protein